MPPDVEGHGRISSFNDLVRYGEENGFDAVGYDEFYNSLPEEDKKTAPPRRGPMPFFALFHPINKKPMFVLVDQNAPRMIPDFREVVDDIIGHEKVHGIQNARRSGLTFRLPDPTKLNTYFSNTDEVMAFAWSIASGLAKTNTTIPQAMYDLEEEPEYTWRPGPGGRQMRIPTKNEPHKELWSAIKRSVDEKVLRKYHKYIYQYLDEMLGGSKDQTQSQKVTPKEITPKTQKVYTSDERSRLDRMIEED